jgi:hypothetical protein
MLPRRRENDLLVRELSDETIVYDLTHDRAHCLNPTAAAVWRQCDGRTNVAQLAAMLRREWNPAADENVVWLALGQLQKARLLQTRVHPPSGSPRVSRRAMIRNLGIAAALPVVMTILAPTARAQASDTCTGMGTPCSNHMCSGTLNCNMIADTMICECNTLPAGSSVGGGDGDAGNGDDNRPGNSNKGNGNGKGKGRGNGS